MKRFFTLLCVLALCVSLMGISTYAETAQSPEKPNIKSEAALVLDADTGTTLYQKNEKALLPPADPAQIMTVLLALEAGVANQTVTVTEEISTSFDARGNNIPLAKGEEVKVLDLLYAVMLESKSDAAKTVAATVSGSEKAFAEKMTQRLREITGSQTASFGNADGEPHEGNSVSARDMALLTVEALKNTEFRKIFGTAAYVMSPTNKNVSERSLQTICRLMRDNGTSAKYEGIVGGKTGYNKSADYTIVTAVERNGRTLVCVVLGSDTSDLRYNECTALLNYAFTAYRNIIVPTTLLQPTELPVIKDGKTVRTIRVSIPEGTILSTDKEFQEGTMSVSSLPTSVQEGATNITLTVSAKDMNNITTVLGAIVLEVETRDPLASTPVPNPDDTLGSQTVVPATFGAKLWGVVKTILWILLYIVLALILLVAVLIAVSYVQRRKRRALRRRRAEERKREEEEEESRQKSPYTGRRHRGIPVNVEENDDDDEDEF